MKASSASVAPLPRRLRARRLPRVYTAVPFIRTCGPRSARPGPRGRLPFRPRPIVAALVFLLDLLGAAAALIVLVTIVAGPWTITVGGHLLRARSTGNLIVGLLLVAALRALAPARPLLAVPGWSLPAVRRTRVGMARGAEPPPGRRRCADGACASSAS